MDAYVYMYMLVYKVLVWWSLAGCYRRQLEDVIATNANLEKVNLRQLDNLIAQRELQQYGTTRLCAYSITQFIKIRLLLSILFENDYILHVMFKMLVSQTK